MFHGKVHPERSTAAKEFTYEIQNALYDDGCDNRDEDGTEFPHGYMLREPNQCFMSNLNLPHDMLSSGSSGSGEHWIKTDADCKYISKLHF